MPTPYCVGLTGSMASGKSTVAQGFADLQVPIVNADAIAKALSAPDQAAYTSIVDHFGQAVLNPDQTLNRLRMRELIFTNPSERLWLEGLLHPLIRQSIEQAVQNITAPYCVVEIPLLKDKKSYPYLNRVLLVKAQPEQQRTRLVTRDQVSEDQALLALSQQIDVETYQSLADDVIVNEGSVEQLRQQVQHWHQTYLTAARHEP